MKLRLSERNKKLLVASSIITGTVVGAGFLGIPYVAARAGFFVALWHILIIGALILLINLSFGEVILRTKGEHHFVGFAHKYLGKKGKDFMFLLVVFSIFSALIAYMIGIGESLSFLFFGNSEYRVIFGALFGFLMSYLLWGGLSSLRKYEKIGVASIFFIFILIGVLFLNKIKISNLLGFDRFSIFLPFGVVLFSLMGFFSLPLIRSVLNKNEDLTKKAITIGVITPMIFYIFFTLIVVGFAGTKTPQVATLAFGPLFIILGILTMFTSYLALGNALERGFMIDYKNKKKIAWFKSSIIPIAVFLLLELFDFFSFTNVLSIGGVFAGGLIAMMVLVLHKKANRQGNRIPEYKIHLSKAVVVMIFILLIGAVVMEILRYFN